MFLKPSNLLSKFCSVKLVVHVSQIRCWTIREQTCASRQHCLCNSNYYLRLLAACVFPLSLSQLCFFQCNFTFTFASQSSKAVHLSRSFVFPLSFPFAISSHFYKDVDLSSSYLSVYMVTDHLPATHSPGKYNTFPSSAGLKVFSSSNILSSLLFWVKASGGMNPAVKCECPTSI